MFNLYPYYLVRKQENSDDLSYAGDFTQGDTKEPADKKTEFAAYICESSLRFEIHCFNPIQAGIEYVRLNFDPAHSGRRPHNLVQVTVSSAGECKAEKMEYDIIHLTPVDGVTARVEKSANLLKIFVEIPLSLIWAEPVNKRYIGFNLIRSTDGVSGSKWSGLPGELCLNYLQGIGDLIFTDGLSNVETEALVESVILESNTYYTRWEKQKLPKEILRFSSNKKHGLTLRIKKEDVATAIDNMNSTKWGKEIASHILDVADYWVSKSEDELFDIIPVGNPRAMTPSQFFGDPLTGGNRTSLATCLETPYKFYNEETKEWWYHGKKVINPATGEEITVEDTGEGFLQPEGFANPHTRCMLVAAYRNYILGMLMAAPYGPSITDTIAVPESSGTRYSGAVLNLAYAFLLSGDLKYAYKAAIIIGRIAELYPFMNGGYHDGSYSDTVHIEEPSTTGTEWKKSLLEAYDMIYDSIDQFHDELKALFNRKLSARNDVRNCSFDLRRAVEVEMIPYVIYSCELERSGASDWSMRLLELEMEVAALIQNGELLKEVLLDSKYSLFSKLRNGYYRDGKYAYDSSSYVEGMSVAMMNYPNWTYLFQDEKFFIEPLNLFEDSRFGVSEAIAFYYHYKNGGISSSFGDIDVNNLQPISIDRKRGLVPYISSSETLYHRMPSMRKIIGAALAMYSEEELSIMRVNSTLAVNRGVSYTFTLLAHGLPCEELDKYRTKNPPIQTSFLAQDSEISILRSGTTPANLKHLVLYGQPTLPHCHGDKLGLWLGAFGVHLLAFGGQYPYIWIGPKIRQWELHSASCNVVLIDGKNQAPSSSSQIEHYEGEWLQVAGMENFEAYPDSHYERCSWLIRTPDCENAYVLDQFMTSNGFKFDYNTHGLDVSLEKVKFEGINEWIPLKGTLAGEDVPLYSQPGYGWMKALQKANVKGTVSWEFQYEECKLKITALNNGENRELYCCYGEKGGFEMKKSAWDTYVLLRDEGKTADTHKTLFTTVMEPYSGAPFLKSIQLMELLNNQTSEQLNIEEFTPVGIEVSYLEGGIRDILICSRKGKQVCYSDSLGMKHTTDAEALLLRYIGTKLSLVEGLSFKIIISDGKQFKVNASAWQGVVENVEPEERKITVRLSGEIPSMLEINDAVGFINGNEYKKPSPYYLREVKIEGSLLTFNTDITLIRGEEDWLGAEKRRVQQGKPVVEYADKKVLLDVKPGDRFYIKNRKVIKYIIE